MKRCIVLRVTGLLALLAATPAAAHKPSDSYLRVSPQGGLVAVQWDIALRDLEHAIGIDTDGNGSITWGEVRVRHDAIATYAMSRLQLGSQDGPCSLAAPAHLVDRHSDGAYAVLKFTASCPGPVRSLEIGYRLFFDLDPQHRGLLSMVGNSGTQTFLFTPEQRQSRIHLGADGWAATLAQFWRSGVWHIWIGFDHILFLLSLLIPAVLQHDGRHWRIVGRFGPALAETVRIVTAFTIAHSITLSLAALGTIHLASRWVESGIAASVAVAALNNLVPVFPHGRWRMAFAFGLLHGFGFASVLADPPLPAASMLVALLGFNLGVESGQLAIVLVFLPLAYAARDSWFYRRFTVYAGSTAIAVVAAIWFVERFFELRLIS